MIYTHVLNRGGLGVVSPLDAAQGRSHGTYVSDASAGVRR